MTRTRRLLTVILSVFSLLLIATAGFAASRPDAAVRRAESVTSTQPGDDDEQAGEDEQGDDQGSAEGATGATGSTGSTGDGSTVDPAREAACNEAAGIVLPPTDGTGTTDGMDGTTPDPVKLTGLDNAISHVLANCMKNPDAPGLVNALEHLVANQTKHEAHDAAKAERKAEQAARKAGHGQGGDHGNPHADGGSGNPHGGGNGGGNGHGNGHH